MEGSESRADLWYKKLRSRCVAENNRSIGGSINLLPPFDFAPLGKLISELSLNGQNNHIPFWGY